MKKHTAHKLVSRFADDTQGATLVELAIVIPVLLLLVLGAIEYGRFGYHEIMAQKATDLAVRTAAVRPVICDGTPDTFQAIQNTTNPPKFGSLCRAGNACAPVADAVCNLASPGTSLSQPFAWTTAQDRANSAAEIWATIAPLLPNDATPADVWITYSQDTRLGFLGGPYSPVVTVELGRDIDGNGTPDAIPFRFITPLGALAQLATGNASQIGANVFFPSMSASMPAEDLGHGTGYN